ncbi:hypothetical protein [Gracilimonas sediminicola]|uniref:hypothetical protein n=1 Tax=Gracilimonas sediminicola TaxID=2952158 RepID=UPI0038D4ECB3
MGTIDKSEVNLEKPLSLKIRYEGEIFTVNEVSDLLKAYNDQYSRFIDDNVLVISDVKKGSLEVAIQELVPAVAASYPLIAEVGIVRLFENLKTAFDFFKEALPTRDKAIENNINKNVCTNVEKIVQPVTKDNSSSINYFVMNGDVIVNNYQDSFSSQDANLISNRAKETKKILNEKSSETLENEPFRFHQIRKNIKTGTGDRVIVESISDKPLKVRYDDISIKEDIVESSENTFNFIFVADMIVQYKGDKPDTVLINELNDQISADDFNLNG